MWEEASIKRREDVQICFDILEAINRKHPIIITHIMFATHMNTQRLKSKLELLVSNSLVETVRLEKKSLRTRGNHSNRIAYRLTSKGKQTLEQVKPFFIICKSTDLTKTGEEKRYP